MALLLHIYSTSLALSSTSRHFLANALALPQQFLGTSMVLLQHFVSTSLALPLPFLETYLALNCTALGGEGGMHWEGTTGVPLVYHRSTPSPPPQKNITINCTNATADTWRFCPLPNQTLHLKKYIYIYPVMFFSVLVLLSASVERFSVSRMRDFKFTII